MLINHQLHILVTFEYIVVFIFPIFIIYDIYALIIVYIYGTRYMVLPTM
jgi:hypothetical protein